VQKSADNPSAKTRWKNSQIGFLISRRHPPRWLSSKWLNCQYGVLLISAGAIEGHIEGKTMREIHQGGLVFAQQSSGSRALITHKKLYYLVFQCLVNHPILRIWPRRPTTCSLDWKQLKTRNFSSDAEIIAAVETWLDRQISNSFEWLEKVRATV